VRGFVLPKAFRGNVPARTYGLWWALTASASVLTPLLFVALAHRIDRLPDLFAAFSMRSSGNAMSFSAVLESRKNCIYMTFTPFAIAVGKVGLVVCLIRFLWYRRDGEFIPLSFWCLAVAYYIVFKQGADVHIFWAHFFGLYFAFAVGAIAATVRSVAIGPIARRLRG